VQSQFTQRSTAASCRELLSHVRLVASDADVGDVISLEKISFPAAASRTENGKLPMREVCPKTKCIPRILVDSCATEDPPIIQNSKIKHRKGLRKAASQANRPAAAPIDSPLRLPALPFPSNFSISPFLRFSILRVLASISKPSRIIESAGEKSRPSSNFRGFTEKREPAVPLILMIVH